MKFKPGDIVIKSNGGNKMTIFDRLSDNLYRCIWFVGSSYNESTFTEDQIVSIPEWRKLIKSEERDDKINQLFQ